MITPFTNKASTIKKAAAFILQQPKKCYAPFPPSDNNDSGSTKYAHPKDTQYASTLLVVPGTFSLASNQSGLLSHPVIFKELLVLPS